MQIDANQEGNLRKCVWGKALEIDWNTVGQHTSSISYTISSISYTIQALVIGSCLISDQWPDKAYN